MKKLLIAAVMSTAVLASTTAYAGTVDAVDTIDSYYGNFSGTIAAGATGSAAILNWDSAIFGPIFTIDFTNGAGVITDVLFSDAGQPAVYPGDPLQFDGHLSGDPAIGTLCVAGPSTACLVATGTTQDLNPLITSFNGGSGYFNDGDLSVVVGDAVPEPASMGLLGVGFAMLGLLRRRPA